MWSFLWKFAQRWGGKVGKGQSVRKEKWTNVTHVDVNFYDGCIWATNAEPSSASLQQEVSGETESTAAESRLGSAAHTHPQSRQTEEEQHSREANQSDGTFEPPPPGLQTVDDVTTLM